MLNSCTFIGRWSKDLEIFQSDKGTDILNTALAVSDPFDKDNPLFIDTKAFNKQALNAHQFTQKGSKVAVEGKIKLEKWTTQDGQNRSKHVLIANQIVFLDEKSNNQSNNQNTQNNQSNNDDPYGEPLDISDRDLPF